MMKDENIDKIQSFEYKYTGTPYVIGKGNYKGYDWLIVEKVIDELDILHKEYGVNEL